MALALPASVAAQSPAADEETAGGLVPPTVTSSVRNQLGFAFPEAPPEAQEKVLGVFTDDGQALAVPVAAVREELEAGRPVAALGVSVVPDASGVRAIDEGGNEVVGHEAFWFAWSQFNPETLLWTRSDPS